MHQAFSNGFVLEIQLIPTICYRLQRAPKTQEMVFYSCGVSILILGGGGAEGALLFRCSDYALLTLGPARVRVEGWAELLFVLDCPKEGNSDTTALV